MTGVLVSTTINGDAVQFACPTDEVLLDSLRNRVGLTGAKEGCGTGDCGACSITLDGRLVCACLVLGVEANGREIGTVVCEVSCVIYVVCGVTQKPWAQKSLNRYLVLWYSVVRKFAMPLAMGVIDLGQPFLFRFVNHS